VVTDSRQFLANGRLCFLRLPFANCRLMTNPALFNPSLMNNVLSDSTRRLLGKRRRSSKHLLLILLVAVILWLPNNFINQYSFGFVGGESGNLAITTKNSVSEWWEKLFNKENVASFEEDKINLMRENAMLKEQIRKSGINFEGGNLSSLFNLAEVGVIGKDSFLGTPLIFIFGGGNIGLREGMPVLDNRGSLLGTVKTSQQKISQVILTPNHDSRIGARIAGTDWDGIVEGNRDLRMVLEMLPLDSQIKKGDQVITDNRNPDIPAGILIGTVATMGESDDHLFKEAILDSPWETKKLDKAWVVIGIK